eukprot:TRINITY_DN1225_c0_g2_i2.p1 TRINITY_DN1225_c0_g2~~TRINITY_DN1225_c0_g2_i2.p1  ORF type:complete len:1200 (+),score=415.97 TRINITY_DN1225_c0_g2_i2:189-3788(+)
MISRVIAKKAPFSIRAFAPPKMLSLKVDGKSITVPKGIMLADAIKMAGANVPTMCYHPDLPTSGGICRVCLVESATSPGNPIISCRTPVENGMDILTQGSKMKEYRQANLALMLAQHPNECLSCPENMSCKTQKQAGQMNTGQCGFNTATPPKSSKTHDKSTAIERDFDKCINCDICVHTCAMQGVGALNFYNEGGHVVKSMEDLDESECIQCGQCINRCPTGAITEKSEIRPVLDAIGDPSKTVVFQMAPSIRVAIAEEFGFKPGEKILKNEIATALRKLGSNVFVLDTNFSADLTIIEEGHELIERLYRNVTGKKLLGSDKMPTDLPMFTSCCPGWIMFMEKNYPDLLNNLSTCKSPQGMLGALIKGYWAKNVKKMDPKDIVSVSIMPCTAKKAEKERSQLKGDEGLKDVDYILTTRELAKMLKQSNIDLGKMEPTPFDKVMSEGTGAAVIFGVTGGVMEAALRTAYEVITGREIPFKNLNVEPVRGMEGIREAGIKLENVLDKYKDFEGVTVKVAIAHGPNNARKILEVVRQAKAEGKPAPWHFIEVMACPGGCIGGGGQPKPTNLEVRKARTELTFKEDMDLPLRKSHENPEVKALYEAYLKEPLGHNSHHYLHTSYTSKQVRNMSSYNADEAKGVDEILAKYPKESQYLLPIIIEEHDKKGYISDPSLVKIAKHLGMYPSQVESILSSYHYFPREYTSDSHVYLCTCHNCMMKGQGRLLRTIQEKYDINDAHGGVAKNGVFTLHTINWLGFCVNDAPAMMIKRKGTDYIETFTGLLEDNIDGRLESLKALNKELPKWPKNNIVEMKSERNGNGYSCKDTNVPLGEAAKKAVSMGPDKVIEEVFKSNLVGRGGAGFRTGKKWESAYKTPASDKYVVCNADEGLPSTYKDWWLLNNETKRKEVLTGMGICARTIGAKKCFIYLRYEYRNLVPALEQAAKDVQSACPELAHLKYEVRLGGGPYVAGEENAQFESIEGRPPLPRKDRPANVFPTVEGLFHKPTVINNVETFYEIPHIIHKGSETFGEGKMPKLLSVTGDVEKPVLIESNLNNYTLNNLLQEIKASDIVAAEIGGCTEPIIFSSKFDKTFGFGRDNLNAVGSVVLFNSSCDLGKIYENKLWFMADESCKQCVPCRDGSLIFYRAYKELKETGKCNYSMRALNIAAEAAAKSSICAHGKALDSLVKSAFDFLNKKRPHSF